MTTPDSARPAYQYGVTFFRPNEIVLLLRPSDATGGSRQPELKDLNLQPLREIAQTVSQTTDDPFHAVPFHCPAPPRVDGRELSAVEANEYRRPVQPRPGGQLLQTIRLSGWSDNTPANMKAAGRRAAE